MNGIVLHPARRISCSINFIHGIAVDSNSPFYATCAASDASRFMFAANATTSHVAGEDAYTAPSVSPHDCYVDMLQPFAFSSDAASDAIFGGNSHWDSMCELSDIASHGIRSEDSIYVLYADGDEKSLTSMQDILTGIKTPWTIKEAMSGPQRAQWLEALRKEMQLLKDHGTYVLVDRKSLPPGTPVVSSKIAWRLKLDKDGNPVRYKARCVARGFSQIYGVNYKETFQPVARLESVRAFIANAVMRGLPMYQLDFEGAYLQGKADFPIYMSFPKELNDLGIGVPEGKVAFLQKSLYGLAQAGHVWWSTLTTQLRSHGFKPTDAEPCCWIYRHNGTEIQLILHVDDGLLTTTNLAECAKIMGSINKQLKHTVQKEPADWYLGMKISQEISNGRLDAVTITQQSYMEQICKSNGVDINSKVTVHSPCTDKKMSRQDAPATITPEIRKQQEKFRSNVGAILFLARCTMPTLSYAIGRLGQFASNSGPEHWREMQHLCKYIKSVRHMGLRFSRPKPGDPAYLNSFVPTAILASWNKDKPHFKFYTDSDFAGCPDTSRSTSGGVITWMGASISWSSRLQACVTLSTAEAEMVAMSKATQEVIWLRRFIAELMGGKIPVPSEVHCDNRASLLLVDNRVHHSRTKHISLRENFIREQKDAGQVNPVYVPTLENLADSFTKPVHQKTLDAHYLALTGMEPRYS